MAESVALRRNIKRDLAAVRRRWDARAKALDEATAERDRVIRDAIGADLPRAEIAELVGLSVQRLDQIRRGARL